MAAQHKLIINETVQYMLKLVDQLLLNENQFRHIQTLDSEIFDRAVYPWSNLIIQLAPMREKIDQQINNNMNKYVTLT